MNRQYINRFPLLLQSVERKSKQKQQIKLLQTQNQLSLCSIDPCLSSFCKQLQPTYSLQTKFQQQDNQSIYQKTIKYNLLSPFYHQSIQQQSSYSSFKLYHQEDQITNDQLLTYYNTTNINQSMCRNQDVQSIIGVSRRMKKDKEQGMNSYIVEKDYEQNQKNQEMLINDSQTYSCYENINSKQQQKKAKPTKIILGLGTSKKVEKQPNAKSQQNDEKTIKKKSNRKQYVIAKSTIPKTKQMSEYFSEINTLRDLDSSIIQEQFQTEPTNNHSTPKKKCIQLKGRISTVKKA